MSRYAVLLLISVAGIATAQPRRLPTRDVTRIDLSHNWRIHSSDGVRQTGAEISSPGHDTAGWLPATIPSTVVAAMAATGKYGDPYYGLNLCSIPGTTYDFGDNFAVIPMPAGSPFRVPWWYRTEFTVRQAAGAARRYWLNFDSLNYRANIWLNGSRAWHVSLVRVRRDRIARARRQYAGARGLRPDGERSLDLLRGLEPPAGG